MIKKMRWRVILAAMVAFFLVIALIATLVNVFNYYSVSRRADQTIEFISGYEKRTPPEPKGEELPKEPGGDNLPKEPPMMMPNVEDNYMTRFFVVRVDSDLNVLSASTDFIATVSEESAHQFAEKALSKSADKGYISDYRYSKETVDGNTIIIFLNVSREIQYMRSLRFLTIIVSGVSLLLVFVLVFLLSGRAVRPLARNIEQQKQFITDASHELKTPLTSISTSIDVISMEHGDDEWTENIKSQTKRMSKLVSELVTLSRLDEEKPLPEKKQFSLSDATWEIVDVYKPQAKAQNKSFEADIANEVSVVGDKTAIQQMLSVLLDNAVKYSTENGNIEVKVFKKRNKSVVEVTNSCNYETPPDTKKLFDRFYRPDASRNSDTGGSGVGLSIAKSVVESHGGNIKAICPDGKSMTIKATL